MTKHAKLQIYQGIIQYLLDSTDYDLKNIAVLSNASIKMIRTIYDGHALGPQSEVVGPCIVEFEHACAVIPPYGVGTVDDYGNMIIELNKVAKKGEAI